MPDTDYAFTTRVDPVSAPPEFAAEHKARLENSERRAEAQTGEGGLCCPLSFTKMNYSETLRICKHATLINKFWWSRRVLPPGPLRLFRKAFSIIAGTHAPALIIIGNNALIFKGNSDFLQLEVGAHERVID